MSERPVMTTAMPGGQVFLYLHEDRVEVGKTDLTFSETLSRVAWRDARRVVAWRAARTFFRWVGAGLAALGLLGALTPVLGATGSGAAIVFVVACTAFVLGVWLMVLGRPGGITRVRIEGVRGDVEAVLSGSRRKRDALVREIEERIHDRQSRRTP